MRVLSAFRPSPPLSALVKNVAIDCRCEECISNRVKGTRTYVASFRHGCLGEAALSAFLMLLAHVIADGFGAPDASGLVDVKGVCSLTQKLLIDLIINRRLSWDEWFQVAAGLYLGCTFRGLRIPPQEGGSLIAAAQYSSLVTVSRWLDMTKPHNKKGCFTFDVAEARIAGIDAVSEEFAVIRTEETMELSYDTRNNPKSSVLKHATNQQNFDRLLAIDTCMPEVHLAIMSTDKFEYRPLTMIKSRLYVPIVDPSQLLWGLIKGQDFQCQHRKDQHPQIEKLGPNTTVWSFEELLGGWEHECSQTEPESGSSSTDDFRFDAEISTCNTFRRSM